MRKKIRIFSRLTLVALIVIVLTSLTSFGMVAGVTEFEKEQQLSSGRYYLHSIENFKNRKFTCELRFKDTAPEDALMYVFVTYRNNFTAFQVGDNEFDYGGFINETGNTLLYLNESVYKTTHLQFEVIIPSHDDYSFVWYNPTEEGYSFNFKLSHRHVLFWLWILIPSLVIGGLAAYAIIENVTRYQRAKMTSDKALRKIKSRSEAERKRAAYWFVSNGTVEDLAELDVLLDESPSNVKSEAAFAIGGISKRLNDQSLADSLIRHYEIEDNLAAKEAIVFALSEMGTEKALDILIENLLVDHNEKMRYQIALTLKSLALKRSAPALVEVLNGENTDTLKIACREALEAIASKEGIAVDKLMKK